MKFQLIAAASFALLQASFAKASQTALESDAAVAGGGTLRGILVDSFLESDNKARCRGKCGKADEKSSMDEVTLFHCKNFCDEVCATNIEDNEDKCKKPCDFIDCEDISNDDRSDSCSDSDDCPWDQYCKHDRGDCKGDDRGECTDGGADNDLSCDSHDHDSHDHDGHDHDGHDHDGHDHDGHDHDDHDHDDHDHDDHDHEVCGCDQRTYANECLAKKFGVTVDKNEKCDEEDRDTGDFKGTCRDDDMCDNGYYCKALFQECNTGNDRKGFCTRIPTREDCDKLDDDDDDKVCGCDGDTYDNECHAERKEESVDFRGDCDSSTSSSD